jgi:hypothetical protein
MVGFSPIFIDVVDVKFIDAFFDSDGAPPVLAGPSRHVSQEMRRRKRYTGVAGPLPQGSMCHVRARPRAGWAKTGPDDLLKFP